MESGSPSKQASNLSDGQNIFATLRDVLAVLYPLEQAARIVVDDAGLDGSQLTFSARAQTNWHYILAEAIKHNRLDRLLSIVLANYGDNPSLKAAFDHYRNFVEQGGALTALLYSIPTEPVAPNGGAYVARDVAIDEGDFVGRDKNVGGNEVAGDQVEGDKIDARNSKGFINRPSGPITQNYGHTINIGPRKLSKFFTWTIVALIVVSIGTISYLAVKTSSPPASLTVPALTPTPTPLNGDFTIAVVPFVRSTAKGAADTETVVRQMSEQLYLALDQELAQLRQNGFVIPIRSPTDTLPLMGEDDQTLALAASALATTIHADLIIYGKLEISPDKTTFSPAFWLDSHRLVYAEEAAGLYTLAPITVAGSISANSVVSQQLRMKVTAQAAAFVRFVVGLGYFALNRYPEAAYYLEEARTHAANDDKGLSEITYLFLGSVAAKLHDPVVAKSYYSHALALNDRNPRALLGVAQMQFLQARHDCAAGKIDVEGIQAAATNYQRALTFPSLPSAAIPIKSALLLGNVYLCLSQARQAVNWTDAQTAYEEVLRNYKTEEQVSIRYLAAEASAGLGLLLLLRDANHASATLQQATEHFQNALAWSRQKDRQAIYQLWLAQIQLWQDNCTAAKSSVKAADQLIAEFVAENHGLTVPEFTALHQNITAALVATC